MVAQLTQKENSEITEAYTALFDLIQGFPAALRNTWWSGAYRTLDHHTAAEIVAAIQQYGAMAQKAYERHQERTKRS